MSIELTDRVRMKHPNTFGDDRDGNEVNLSELEFYVTGLSEDGRTAHVSPVSGYHGFGWDVTVGDLEAVT
jgi:hypothetical protein